MNHRKVALLCIAAVLMIGLLLTAGGYGLYNNMFPMADPVKYPQHQEVISMEISCNLTEAAITPEEAASVDLLSCIQCAVPTRIIACNEVPHEEVYYGIDIQTAVRPYQYYVYESNGNIYLEDPYDGVYLVDETLLSIVKAYFPER